MIRFSKFFVRFRCLMSPLSDESDEKLTPDSAESHVTRGSCRSSMMDVAAIALRYRPFLKAIAASEFPDSLKPREDDSDLVQEALLKATQQADQFRGTSEPELTAWLREILLNLVHDRIRYHHRLQRSIENEVLFPLESVAAVDATVSEQIRQAEARDLTQRALSELPEDYRNVLLLRQQMGLTFVEIADHLQRSPDAVRMLWGRAILLLGRKLRSLR
jgi:RNA polymerase sigma-70 factor (ECF subfamily)